MNIYMLPNDIKLYSKKEISDMGGEFTKYWSCVDEKYYNAAVKDGKCIAKQYPGKHHFYLIGDLYV